MAKIRRKKIDTNYTVVENDFLRDRELGLTERGLLMTMLSLPDNWDYSAKGLASILPDGKKKTNNSLQRLEKAGYLKRSRIYEGGKVVDWLYEFCEQPVFKEENLVAPKGEVEKNLVPPFVQVEKVEVQNEVVHKGSDNKSTKEESKNKLNTKHNQSINHKRSRLIDDATINDIRDQIDYDNLEYDYDKNLLDTAVCCIADLYSTSEPQTFNQRTYAADFIRHRSLALSNEHIRYALDCFQEKREPIQHVRNYLKTTIFNAPETLGAHRENTTRVAGFLE